MIIVDELPFSFVEKEGFKNFMRVTMPQFHIPSRRIVTRDCYELYLEERKLLKRFSKKHVLEFVLRKILGPLHKKTTTCV